MQHPDDDPDDEEAALFRRAVQDVRPLKGAGRAPAVRRLPRPRARFARAERAAVLRESLGLGAAGAPGTDLYELQPGDELLFRRAGVPETVLRRLRRGHYRVDSEIDLHGLTVADASARLGAFLREARARDLRCVRVIHGKGLRSGTRGPVLKNTVNALLRRADAVLAFASARPVAGGTGATLVLLARP
ncbi:MAG TPA: Smr/MutS family protein [Steroidobacteraceae bacterium]|jgi:DNA-nicking Smr family endonuclease|nr:Smr/MutS family protein [Steroidobacteraceae bacterium]